MMFTDRAIQVIADDKIQSAIRRGEFDRLPGFGQPLWFDDDDSDDPNWWLRRKVRDEGLGDVLHPTTPVAIAECGQARNRR